MKISFNSLEFLDNEINNLLLELDKLDIKEFEITMNEINETLGKNMLKYSTMEDFNKYNRLKKMNTIISMSIKNLYLAKKNNLNKHLKKVYLLNHNSGYYIAKLVTDKNFTKKTLSDLNILIVNDIFDIEQTTLKHANQLNSKTKQAIYQGILQGKSYDSISKDIQKDMNISKSKAQMISQTETHRVINKARYDSMLDLSNQIDMQKQWVSTIDKRTRPAHRTVDGQVVDVDKPFEVGGEYMMYPNDPNASGRNTVRCRCTMISYFNDLEYQKRKENISKEYMTMKSYDEWESSL